MWDRMRIRARQTTKTMELRKKDNILTIELNVNAPKTEDDALLCTLPCTQD